jgi:hypothetical protein
MNNAHIIYAFMCCLHPNLYTLSSDRYWHPFVSNVHKLLCLISSQNTGMGNHQLMFTVWWQVTDGYCAWERLRRHVLHKYEYLASLASALIFTVSSRVEEVVPTNNSVPNYGRKWTVDFHSSFRYRVLLSLSSSEHRLLILKPFDKWNSKTWNKLSLGSCHCICNKSALVL